VLNGNSWEFRFILSPAQYLPTATISIEINVSLENTVG
jgi:hypothetical protein